MIVALGGVRGIIAPRASLASERAAVFNGFSADGVAAFQAGGSSIILMDGGDLMAVFEERIDFVSLLLRKKRHASQTGNIYYTFFQMAADSGG